MAYRRRARTTRSTNRGSSRSYRGRSRSRGSYTGPVRRSYARGGRTSQSRSGRDIRITVVTEPSNPIARPGSGPLMDIATAKPTKARF